jgi:hypothetical protein
MRNIITSALHQASKSRKVRGAGHVERTGDMRNMYEVSVGKLESKRPLGRRRRRWEDNIRMDTREMGWEGVDRAHDMDQGQAVVKTVTNLRVP